MLNNYFFQLILCISFFLSNIILAQQNNFDVSAYNKFLQKNQNLSSANLLSSYPAGLFLKNANVDYKSAKYFDSIDYYYKLTDQEKYLLNQHGFMVSERLTFGSFQDAIGEIYKRDLPIFISTDAILHALHRSYESILEDIEYGVLFKELDTLLRRLHQQLPELSTNYSSNPGMAQKLKDLDVYLTVPRKLLGNTISPYYPENSNFISDLLKYINAEQPVDVSLFSNTPRTIDFSQFKPRGHYTRNDYPLIFANYFRAMMWLGRIEIYLLAPGADLNVPSVDDVQRQTIMGTLLVEAMQRSNSIQIYNEINDILQFFVGEQDNVTLTNMQSLLHSLNIDTASQLLDPSVFKRFQDTLKTCSFASQRILSQILMTDINSPDKIMPASSLLLFGQRFIIDSYIMGQVVFDKIRYNNTSVTRMLPSSLDVLFGLGNNSAAQLLQPELDKYHYSSNLSALRYLVDSYPPEFWNLTLFNTWLNSIRKLNPPADRNKLPLFMQTAAWWQEKMNTQLASWAELRHDNILYAKQSYSGGITCSFPSSYVEPIPEFYGEIGKFASNARNYFQNSSLSRLGLLIYYFNNVAASCAKLESIAKNEIDGIPLSDDQKVFLSQMISINPPECNPPYDGWYPRMFYTGVITPRVAFTIADVHTAPTDEFTNPVGWVLHAGTGPMNLGVFIIQCTDSVSRAYLGPVSSYYEYLSTNFKRLTDEEWQTLYYKPTSIRPSFVNLYLADTLGKSKGYSPSLLTSVKTIQGSESEAKSFLIAQNFPNPFNSSTVIWFNIPYNLSNSRTKLTIFDALGKEVAQLLDMILPEGNYLTRWDAADKNKRPVVSGIYFYQLTVGSKKITGKMNLVK